MQNYDGNYNHYGNNNGSYHRKKRGGCGCLSVMIVAVLIILALSIVRLPGELVANLNIETVTDPGFEDFYDLIMDSISEIFYHETETEPSAQDESKDKHETKAVKESEKENTIIKTPEETLPERSEVPSESASLSDSSQAGYYCYNLLNDDLKLVYREILEAITERKEKSLSTLDTTELNTIYNYIVADHPEIFYSSGIHYTQELINGTVTSIKVRGQYSMDEETAASYEASMVPVIQSILVNVPGYVDGTETSDYEKIKYIYDYIIENTEYVPGSDENQNIVSVLLNHRSVCNGYAKTFQYLSQQLGIPAVLVTGYAEGGLHAWNAVLMDGAWYQFDVTFGDSQISSEKTSSFTNYAYFGLTDQQMNVNHSDLGTIPVPSCTSTSGNYFIKNGTYFDNADAGAVGELARSVQASGGNIVQFRTDSSETMSALMDSLFTNQRIYDYLDNVRSFNYTLIDSQNTMIIIF
ncbi:transglutaminase domain-containing protein [Oribacterium sp. P6A1]|uniref:transglutaminase domain-containing protein n=1 Tax=Oribacterium sp. P6A1 TaxID=1410612 RepID=UPI0005609A59|nr:transglutaminase domain-containing protein [Oribacterium sp. P6A1]